ncbi:DUF4004 family protein [Macrococcus sp. DPC7161]|uniref:DUF4004 family protein n=1 Tax=Macrococcus sp. DPC7161 TaxID=2507060 RepID=UPI00100B8597|nr:DUF4004 family protein [Macrococcus sp. DPC7161]RXK17500.1 DUF4004 family protein [Macrococcus sp. DPC7161]
MEELISKKELLKSCDISYGQLYRWKRKKLIPEDWFIRKSTYTGQEAFFPKQKIIERIEMIKKMKDEYSLDDLQHVFEGNVSVTPNKKEYSSEQFKSYVWDIAENLFEKRNTVSLNETKTLSMIHLTLESGYFSREEVLESAQVYHQNQSESSKLYFLRNKGVFIFVISKEIIAKNPDTKVIYQLEEAQIYNHINQL